MKKFFAILAVIAMYLSVSELNAKRKADEMCGSVKLGDETAGLLERGLAMGARKKSIWLDQLRWQQQKGGIYLHRLCTRLGLLLHHH